MDCAERDRLKEILRIATSEIGWVYEERARIAVNHASELTRFEEVIEFAQRRHDEAALNYRSHLQTHHCGLSDAPPESIS